MKTKLFPQRSPFFLPLLALTVLLFSFEKSDAGVIQGVTINAVSSEYTSGNDLRRATNMLNGVGLFGDLHTSTAPGSMWLTLPTTTGAVTNAFVTFDLGAVHTINQMKVWNYNEGSGVLTQRGIQRADISIAGEDLVFTTNLPNAFFNRAPGTFTNFAQTFDFAGASARYVRINVKTNHYVSGTAENRVGLSKVQFIDNTVQPTIVSANKGFFNDRVTVVFSEAVLASSATNIANYIIHNDTNVISVVSATLDRFSDRVVLQTGVMDSNLVYSVSAINLRDASNIVDVATNEVTISSELALWLKADAGVVADGSEVVSEWDDQSGNGNNSSQATAAYMPTRVQSALNGLPVLHFNGSGVSSTPTAGTLSYLEVPHSPSLAVKRDATIFAVVRANDITTYQAVLMKTTVNQPSPLELYLNNGNNSGLSRFGRGNGGGSSAVVATRPISTGTDATNFYIISTTVNGTNASSYLNGSFNGSAGLTVGVLDTGGPLRIGTRADFVTRMRGDIAEVMLFRGSLPPAERSQVESYLGTKYGIPVINLEFLTQPQSRTNLEGQIATFSVSVAASSPTVTYQWQRNGTNILDATNAIYRTPYLTQADNNSTYKVLVSIPGSSQFSDTATLTVLQDLENPIIVSAGRKIWNPSEIVIVFSERVQAAAATTASNYTLDNGASVTSASFGETTDKIVLTTSGMAAGTYLLSVQNVQDLYTNTMLPAQVSLGVYPVAALWLKSDAGVTTNEFGLVSQWDDQSGNGNNAVPFFLSGEESYPLLTNGFNNGPVVHFGLNGTTATTNYLTCNFANSLALTGDMSIYAVASFVDYSGNRCIMAKTTANQPAPYDVYLTSGSGLPRLIRGNGTASTITTANSAASAGVPHIIYATSKDNAVAHFLDGKANGTATVTAPIADNGGPLFIGHRLADAGTTMKGDIAEILLFGSSLTDADRASMDLYFSTRYNLVIGTLPRISIAPTNGNAFLLSWPVPTLNFALESANDLSGANWLPVTNSVASAGGTNSVTVDATGGQQFYRLRKQ